jgi:DNA-binding YbaB/EbfC family protein
MLKGLGDIGNLMRMQKEMKNIQKTIKKAKIEGESRDGLVKAVVNGEFSLLSITISDDLVKSGNTKEIEKKVFTAINDAMNNAREYSTQEMKKITGGMDLGSLFQ